jgi:Cu/Ag efflux pump CusA
MREFNLSEWALEHQSLVLFFMLALFAAGVFSYLRLGQAEDPDFTFKLMVVRAIWPGASPREMEEQVTERLEKKLQRPPSSSSSRIRRRQRRSRASGIRCAKKSATCATCCRTG